MKSFIKLIIGLIVPFQLRRKVRQLNKKWVLDYHLNKIKHNPAKYLDGSTKSFYLMNRLIYGWGNPDWSADAAYLIECANQAKNAKGRILECGSGLTTLVMSAVCNDNASIVCLEHHEQWALKIREQLERNNSGNVSVNYCPLKSYGDYDWYHIDGINLDNIALVICDGPPSNTKGGRIGLLPVMNGRFKLSCIILLDDYQRLEEREILKSWNQNFKISYEIKGRSVSDDLPNDILESSNSKQYAVINVELGNHVG